MKKKYPVSVLLFALGVLLFTACGGGGADADAGAAESEETATEETAAAPRIVKVNSFLTEASVLTDGTKLSVASIEEFSDGALVGEGYYNGTLIGFGDTWEALGNGTVDIAYVPPALTGQYSTLLDIFSLPIAGMPTTGNWANSQAFNELVQTRPEFDAEMAKHNLKIIFMEALPGSNIHSSKKTVPTPADAKGIVIEALGNNSANFFGDLGANTVTLDTADYFVSMQRGVIDAFFNQWGMLYDFQLMDLATHHTIFGDNSKFPPGHGLAASTMIYAANLDFWNSLTESGQDAIMRAFAKGCEYAIVNDNAQMQVGYDYAVEQGHEILVIDDPAQLALWFDAAQPTVDKWVEEVSAEGYDGAAILADFRKILEQYE
jgi:TRAP-type C4-dicarboxylate transport system substrate-binding protein